MQEARFLPDAAPAADGLPFELALVRAMVGAAKADGHVDAAEQSRIFAHVERLDLPADAKAWVFDILAAPVGVSEVAAAARTPEQAVPMAGGYIGAAGAALPLEVEVTTEVLSGAPPPQPR